MIFDALFGEGDKPPEQVFGSQSLRGATEAANQQIGSNLSANQRDIDAYAKALSGSKAGLADIGSSLQSYTKGILGRANDPLGDYQNLLNYTLSKIQPNVLNNITNAMSNRLRQQSLARGINTGLDSTYDRLQQNNLNSQAYLNAYNAALANAGQTSANLANQRLQTYQQALMAAYQPMTYANQLAGRELLPMGARNQALQDLFAQAMQSAQANKANVYGYNQPTNIWDKMGKSINNTIDTAERVASIYSSLYGGGMGGGGGRQQSQQQPNFQMARESQIDRGYGVPNYDASYDRYLRAYDVNSPNYYSQYGF